MQLREDVHNSLMDRKAAANLGRSDAVNRHSIRCDCGEHYGSGQLKLLNMLLAHCTARCAGLSSAAMLRRLLKF